MPKPNTLTNDLTVTGGEVLYEIRDRVAIITFNRPERLNAWTDSMEATYYELLERASADSGVRAIILTGSGRGFCAGADISLLHDVARAGIGPLTSPGRFNLPLSIPKPIIAAINGPCAGIGFIHAVMCDVRFGAAGAKFTTAFARRGLVAEYNMAWLMPRLLGQGVALDLLLSARVFLAEEALQLGLLNRVYPPEQLFDATLAYAKDLAEHCSPASMGAIKRQVYAGFQTTIEDSTASTRSLMDRDLHWPDLIEGVESFLEKRSPNFAPVPPLPEGFPAVNSGAKPA